MVGLAFK
jgi:hypothetical protein